MRVSFTFSGYSDWFKECLELCLVLLFLCGVAVVADLCEVIGTAVMGEAEKEAFLVGQGDGWCRVADLRGVFELSYLDVLWCFGSAYAWEGE